LKFIPKRPGPKRAQFTDTDTGNSPEIQLYDLGTDIGEANNLASIHPEKVKELQTLLAEEKAKGFPAP
jgi:hypothetical protein